MRKKYGIKTSSGVLAATVHLISRFLSSWSSSSLNGSHLVELGDQVESKDIADNLLCLSMLLGMDGLRMKEKGVVKIENNSGDIPVIIATYFGEIWVQKLSSQQ